MIRIDPKFLAMCLRMRDRVESVFKEYCFYPVLIGALPCLRAGADVSYALMFSEIALPVVFCLIAASLIYFLLNIAIKNHHKAALVTSAFFIWFFSFQAFGNLVDANARNFHIQPISLELLLLPYFLMLVAVVYVCLNGSKNLREVTLALNTISLVLTTIAISEVAMHEIYIGNICKQVLEMNNDELPSIKLIAGEKRPDIYYIILDACGSPAVLQRFYHYDFNPFVQFLKSKGFFVATDARSNYPFTKLSLNSSLNMKYLDYLGQSFDADFDDDRVDYSLIQQNIVARCLKQIGYTTVNVCSGFSPTAYNPFADYNFGGILGNRIYLGFAQMTVLLGLENQFHFLSDAARYQRVSLVRELEEIKKVKSPKFVFAHIIMPHPPNVFGANGEHLPWSVSLWNEPFDLKKYPALLDFTEKQMRIVINDLLSDTNKNPPIILVQGDHGPAISYLDEAKPSTDYLQERFHPLSAYYLPDSKTTELSSDISPVNSFRVIFNAYFQAHLKLLPNKSLYCTIERPYQWWDTTLDNKLIPHSCDIPGLPKRHLNAPISPSHRQAGATGD